MVAGVLAEFVTLSGRSTRANQPAGQADGNPDGQRLDQHLYGAQSNGDPVMRRVFAVLGVAVLAALVFAPPGGVGLAWGRPMDGALQRQLQMLYSRYNQEITAGRLNAALALRSSASEAALEQQFKTAKDRQDYLAGAAQMVPDQLELRHASVDDASEKALLIAWADKATPSGQVRGELDIGFVRENGTWKINDIAAGPAPADIKHCNPAYEAIGAYDTSHAVSVTGRIERVDTQPDHTLVVLLAGDTETCAFLPSQTVLQQHGLDPTTLQPFRFAEIAGVANRADPQKVMVNNITVRAEE
jgi:hypothetical protein